MNTAEILDRVFDIYKKTFWRQMARVFIFGVPAFILLAAYSFLWVIIFGAARFNGPVGVIPAVIFILSLVIIFIIWEALSLTGNISLARQAYYGSELSLDVMFKDIGKNILRVSSALFAVVISAVPFAAAGAYIFIAALRIIQDYGFERGPSLAAVIAVIIAVIVIFSILIAFFRAITSSAIPAAIFEKRYFFGAVARSFFIVKGDFFKISGTFLMWQLITAAVNYSLITAYYFASGSLGGISGFFSDYYAPGTISYLIGNNLLTVWVSVIISPFGGIISAVIYINQRIKKEGFDIELRLNRLIAPRKTGINNIGAA